MILQKHIVYTLRSATLFINGQEVKVERCNKKFVTFMAIVGLEDQGGESCTTGTPVVFSGLGEVDLKCANDVFSMEEANRRDEDVAINNGGVIIFFF